jgi:predicted N-acetyltransferase YhbS
MQARVTVRTMVADDLADVSAIANEAFGVVVEQLSGHAVGQPFFPPLMLPTRLNADPEGCLVAEDEAGVVIGALITATRGSLAWFGPLAVATAAQGRGVGQTLVGACVERWRARGVRLMGLETFGHSDQHVYLYSKLGFRASWTAVSLKRALTPVESPDESLAGQQVEIDAAPRNLDYLYPGLDLAAEARAATAGLGATLATGDGGFAILHTEPTFMQGRKGFLPFVAAPDQVSFGRLISAAERLSIARGLTSLEVNVPGGAWNALDALTARSYRTGWTMLRMKQGERPDYDRANIFYCDNWK